MLDLGSLAVLFGILFGGGYLTASHRDEINQVLINRFTAETRKIDDEIVVEKKNAIIIDELNKVGDIAMDNLLSSEEKAELIYHSIQFVKKHDVDGVYAKPIETITTHVNTLIENSEPEFPNRIVH